MASPIEFILKATDEVSPVVGKIESQTKNATDKMKAHWDKVGGTLQKSGIAIAGLGVGLEALARDQREMVEQTRRMSEVLDMSEKSMRDLVIATSNVTFPLEEVLELMELGSQQGIRSAEALKEYATFWDMVGDATGENSRTLAEAGVALKAVGIAAGEEKEALAAFGYITQETTGDVGEFLTFLERTGPELRELGLDLNDSAALVGALEKELGMTARVARQEFRQAVSESNGDLGKMLEILGLTEEQLASYRLEVEKSSGVIEKNAEIHASTMTAMQKVQHWFNEAKFAMSGYIEAAAGVAPLMTGIGSAMTVVGTIMKSNFFPSIMMAAKGVWAFTASILANPLTWWIAGISAVIAAIVLLWKNWETVTEAISKSIDWIAERFEWLGNGIKWIAEKLGIYKKTVDETVDTTEKLAEQTEETNKQMKKLADEEERTLETSELLTEENADLADSFEGVGNSVDKARESFEEYYNRMQQAQAEYRKQVEENERYFEELRKEREEAGETFAQPEMNRYRITPPSGESWITETLNELSESDYPEGYKVQKLHTGGIFRAPTPGGEGLALLKDKEIVSTPGQSGASININEGAIIINTQRLDDREINRVGDKLMDVIISKSRAYNLRFAR